MKKDLPLNEDSKMKKVGFSILQFLTVFIYGIIDNSE